MTSKINTLLPGAAEAALAFLTRVEAFNREVVCLPIPEQPTTLPPERMAHASEHIMEELNEIQQANEAGDLAEAADGWADLAYVAMGRLVEMGITPDLILAAVCDANDAKVRGTLSKRPNSAGYDAVKPDGWLPPDHSWVEQVTPTIARMLSLRASKGRDYNSGGIERRDYYPFGLQSHVHELHKKVLRLRSLLESGHEPENESLRDTFEDLWNYATYAVEELDGGVQS